MSHGDWDGLGDVLVDRVLSGHEIISFLSRSLRLRSEEIFLIEDIEQVLKQPSSARVVCLRSVRTGEVYPLLLSIWGTDEASWPFSMIVGEMCKAFGCRCLIDDGSSDPYSWLQLEEDGGARLTTYYGP